MRKIKKAGYKVKNIPKSKKELIKKLCKKREAILCAGRKVFKMPEKT